MLLGLQKISTQKSNLLDASKLICILLFYAMGRFIYRPLLYCFFFAFLFIFFRSFYRNRKLFKQTIFVFVPIISIFFLAALGCYFSKDGAVANYDLITSVILFSLVVSPNLLSRSNSSTVRFVSVVFVVLVIPFIIFPKLENMGTYEESWIQAQKAMYVEPQAERARAFFYHTNEFAVFAAAFFILQLSAFFGGRQKMILNVIDFTLVVITLCFIYTTRSTTAYFAVVYGVIYRFSTRGIFSFLALFVFTLLTLAQLIYPREVADFIAKGSFFWRFNMASAILHSQQSWLDYSPTLFSYLNLESWPHSFILDIVLCYGYLAGFLPLLTLFAMVFIKKMRPFIGWFSVFFATAAVQPIGAMPVPYLALAIAIGAFISSCRDMPQKTEVKKAPPKFKCLERGAL